ncbi:hypothetical protein JCGZ_23609 [Jatropha curcas]|uniref:RIN4 pathogenic type III effector avirulence factor Avr cleavage site domain-containing protein n=1 Tax=Jatropha curcas TaxID=180498 RepID=A0A067JIK6_JATCU|nr:uncharacterized protein LOC105647789 [Jatropha curcas]KDP23776.1 hypothetical protein JCGZ_23609 [Jatropha curcas]
MDEWKRTSGQIPAFGDWENANEMPITQYFESARQAGLIRYSSSSGECDQYMHGHGSSDLYASDLKKPPSRDLGPPIKTRGRERRVPRVKEQKKLGKVCDVTEPPRKQHMSMYTVSHGKNDNDVPHPRPKLPTRPTKAVDEDLYKIPPELLHSYKRKKKMSGFFSCFAPACAS